MVLEANRLIRRYRTHNPFVIAKNKGITVSLADLSGVKGIYFKTVRRKFITVNQNLDELFRHVVCAHELCHAIKHHDLDWRHIDHFFTYSGRMEKETEANVFTAAMVLGSGGDYGDFDMTGEHMSEELFTYLTGLRQKY